MSGPGRITFSGTYLSTSTDATFYITTDQTGHITVTRNPPAVALDDWNGADGKDLMEPDNPPAACECYSCTAEAELALAHTLRGCGPVHAMTCIPCAASEYAGVPHMDMRYETYWSM